MTNDITTESNEIPKIYRFTLDYFDVKSRTDSEFDDMLIKINTIINHPNPSDKKVAATLVYFFDGKIPYFGITDERWTEAVFKRMLSNGINYAIMINVMRDVMDEVDELPNPDRLIRECVKQMDSLKATAKAIENEKENRIRISEPKPQEYKQTTTRAEREKGVILAKIKAGLIPKTNS